MAKNPNIDDDTRKRAKAFVEKNSKEYRADPFGAMTQKQRDARVSSVDDFFAGAAAEMKPRARSLAAEDDATTRIPSKKQSFKESFAAARKAGGKTFEWNGKKYTTELAKPAAKTMTKEEAAKQLKLGEKVSSEEVEKAKKQLNLAKGGYVNCGASVPPAQKRK